MSLTACTREHHVAAVTSVFVETRDEEGHVDEDEYRDEGDVDVIVLHVRPRELIRTKRRKYAQSGLPLRFRLWWYQPSIYATIVTFLFLTLASD